MILCTIKFFSAPERFFGIPPGAEFFCFKDTQANIIDAQANIVALFDNTGAVVVKYKYDAWGKCKVLNADGFEITDNNHIGILNPSRYPSYYYDHGIGLYFRKTRYYDPEIGRTILTTSSFYIGEFLTKLLFVSSTAAASRWIIDQIFNT